MRSRMTVLILEFGEGAEDKEEAGRRPSLVSIDSVSERSPMPRASSIAIVFDKLLQRPRQAIELPHHERVASRT